jgi:hypothetical protein
LAELGFPIGLATRRNVEVLTPEIQTALDHLITEYKNL